MALPFTVSIDDTLCQSPPSFTVILSSTKMIWGVPSPVCWTQCECSIRGKEFRFLTDILASGEYRLQNILILEMMSWALCPSHCCCWCRHWSFWYAGHNNVTSSCFENTCMYMPPDSAPCISHTSTFWQPLRELCLPEKSKIEMPLSPVAGQFLPFILLKNEMFCFALFPPLSG